MDCLPNRLFRRRSKKHQSSATLAFVRRIHRWPVDSRHKGPATQRMFPFDDVIVSSYMYCGRSWECYCGTTMYEWIGPLTSCISIIMKTWTSWRLKPPFVQRFIQITAKQISTLRTAVFPCLWRYHVFHIYLYLYWTDFFSSYCTHWSLFIRDQLYRKHFAGITWSY